MSPKKIHKRAFEAAAATLFHFESWIIAVACLFLTIFLGATFYEFWVEGVYPLIGILSTLFGFSFLLKFIGEEVYIRPLKSQRLRRNIRGGIGGILVGFILLYMHFCSASTQEIQLPEDSETSAPAQEEMMSNQEAPSVLDREELTGSPEYVFDVGLSIDTDIVSPETVIIHVDSLDRADALIPPNTLPSLVAVIDSDLERMELSRAPENQNAWSALLADTVKATILSDSQPENNLVNGNAAFTSRTQKANELQAALSSNGMDPDKLKAVIQLREEAYGIYATKGLRHLLASDYHRWAKVCLQAKDWEQAYTYYLKSIEFELLYIRLIPELNDEYFDHLYNIATIYQCLGDIPILNADDKKDAYFFSACFYEIVCKHTFESSGEKTGFLSAYYAGMVHHKSYLLGWRERIRASEVYLCDAIAHYQKSLEFSGYGKQRHYQYDFLAQMSSHAQKYIQYFGQPASMLTKAEYRDMELHYRALAH